MKRFCFWCLSLAAIYLASGLYVVRGNEQALVRRFGRAQLPLAASGLHIDLPWPFTRIDRVNVNQVQTLTIGVVPAEPPEGAGFLQEAYVDRQGEFLTGDKNILNLTVNVQYRITDPFAFLCQGKSPEIGIKLLAESLVTDAVARSGVDYVHPLGLNELRAFLTRRTREAADRQPWGILVEDVTIAGAFPPVEVKASFLDVSNARAEKDRLIQQEQSQAEKRLAAARAVGRQRLDQAQALRQARIEMAKGDADRFLTIVAEFRRDAESTAQSPSAVRRRTMQRLFSAAMEQLLP
ncbi:MAG TPA: protease modulator HflK, partial [Planctomycetaceae bacterium]|nr:protease modulator HflK [Planctomycetaceae bacterium]